MLKTRRRRFLKSAGAAAATGIVGGLTGPVGECQSQEVLVTGTSNRGDLQEALQNAIRQALDQQPGYDILLNFEVRAIKGRVGGIAGFNEVTVTIAALFA